MSNVTALKVTPKSINETYKRHKYTVRFKPSTKEWEWIVEQHHVTQYKETAASLIKAQKSAKKFIDQMTKEKDNATR